MSAEFAGVPVALVTGADKGIGLETARRHSLHDGTDAIIAYALAAPGGPTGTFAGRDGEVPW